ncbi:MAG: LPS export ABC transporter permease LptG [Duodenibacillus sp.]|nr:LPS export ABC transporter permease LptG [Duodenibacillus sp.]
MRVVTRHLAKETLIATAFVIFALVALFSFFDLVGQSARIGTRYDMKSALILTALVLPMRVYEVMPVAALLGAVYTMSRWASDSEFTILRVSGLSPQRLALMLFAPASVIVCMTYLFGEFVAPQADKLHDDLRIVLLNRTLSARGYSSGVWVKDVVRGQDGEAKGVRFVNVRNLVANDEMRTGAWRVFEFSAGGDDLVRVLSSDRGEYVQGKGWGLPDARDARLPEIGAGDGSARLETSFQRHSVILDSELTPSILGVMTVKPDNMSVHELYSYLQHLQEVKQTTRSYEVAFWKKLFYPLAIYVMFAVAMPFAYLNARSGGVSIKIFAGLMIGISFYAMNNIFGFLGAMSPWPPILSALTPSLVMLAAATAALWYVEHR